eukprot:4616934-Alexandrium_andersonii.AAC.1
MCIRDSSSADYSSRRRTLRSGRRPPGCLPRGLPPAGVGLWCRLVWGEVDGQGLGPRARLPQLARPHGT